MKIRRIICLILCVTLCLSSAVLLSGCGESKMEQMEIWSMHTTMTLTCYGKNRENGLTAAANVINSLNSMVDPELDTSTVYAINHANGESVNISGQVAGMIEKAKLVYERSDGALDITIYPLLKLWGFIDGTYYEPYAQEILDRLELLCFDQLELSSFPSSGTYSVKLPSYGSITLGAVAKGCASDNAVEAMRNAGVESGIVSLGGNVQTLGYKPDGSLWKVAIVDPNNTSSYIGVLEVGETAVITSGPYQQNFTTVNGDYYHHLLNPTSGYPANNLLSSVTVICEDGTMADCLSTALFVMGQTKAISYWRTYGDDSEYPFEMILVTTGNEIICTSGLIEQFTPSNDNYTVSYTE